MACLVKMKALKSSSEEESFRGAKKKKTTHIKRPYLASSQGVLALAFKLAPIGPTVPFRFEGFLDLGLLSAWTRGEPCGLCSHSSCSFHWALPVTRATQISAG